MDAELEKLAQTVVRIVDSQDPDAYMLMFEALQRTGDALLRERFIELREIRFGALSTGPRLVIVRELLLEVKRTAPSLYEELQAIAEAFAEDEEARTAVGGRTPAPVPSGSSASFTRATSNSVLDGTFHAPVVQADTFSGGVHTYYAQPSHASPSRRSPSGRNWTPPTRSPSECAAPGGCPASHRCRRTWNGAATANWTPGCGRRPGWAGWSW